MTERHDAVAIVQEGVRALIEVGHFDAVIPFLEDCSADLTADEAERLEAWFEEQAKFHFAEGEQLLEEASKDAPPEQRRGLLAAGYRLFHEALDRFSE